MVKYDGSYGLLPTADAPEFMVIEVADAVVNVFEALTELAMFDLSAYMTPEQHTAFTSAANTIAQMYWGLQTDK